LDFLAAMVFRFDFDAVRFVAALGGTASDSSYAS